MSASEYLLHALGIGTKKTQEIHKFVDTIFLFEYKRHVDLCMQTRSSDFCKLHLKRRVLATISLAGWERSQALLILHLFTVNKTYFYKTIFYFFRFYFYHLINSLITTISLINKTSVKQKLYFVKICYTLYFKTL